MKFVCEVSALLFWLFVFVYAGFGLFGFVKLHNFFSERRSLAVRCSLRAPATVTDICGYKRRGRRYVLDYYDVKGAHYCVSYFAKCFPRRWFLNQIVELYYNPADPMEISVPDDRGLLSDARLISNVAFGVYVILGLFAFGVNYFVF